MRRRQYRAETSIMTSCNSKWFVFPAVLCIVITFVVLSIRHPLRKRTADTVSGRPSESADRLLVQTQYGQVRGIHENDVRVFHGVPYAQPPIGDLRFRPPLKPKLWNGILDASNLRPGCPQECVTPIYCTNQSSEDCLFLEIYAPSNVTFPVPVMVYIHGGGFNDVTSTLALFNSTNLVKMSGIIVVHIEYRIGTLGFLVTGTTEDDARGNLGLLDQGLALVWVRENIHAFGGDPDKVTLAGQSAGAQSVLIHLVSSNYSSYFRSAIVESSPVSLPYQTQEVAIKHGQKFAEILSCLVKNSTTISMSCLRNKTVDEILRAQLQAVEDFTVFEKFEPWNPVVDGTIVTEQALTALRTYALSSQDRKPIIFGYTKEEAVLYVRAILKTPLSEFMYELIMMTMLSAIPEVTKLYPVTNSTDTRDDLSVLVTDGIFRCPNRQLVQLLGEHNKNVWIYKWAKPVSVKLPEVFSYCTGRSCHGVEIPYIFQSFHQMLGDEAAEDIVISNKIIDFYSNFIKFGDPNGDSALGDQINTDPGHNADNKPGLASIYWPAVKDNQVNVTIELLFARDGHIEVINQNDDQRCKAWDKSNYSFSTQ